LFSRDSRRIISKLQAAFVAAICVLMKRFRPMAETSKPKMDEQHSPLLERVGKYLFWLLIAAVLLARVAYYPASHPNASVTLSEAKTEMVR
jgi:hypothetical protein